MIEALAIACFISANPSPLDWLISGRPVDVAAAEALVRKEAAGRLIAHAAEHGVGFARFELSGRLTYLRFMDLLDAAQRLRLLTNLPKPTTPSCPDGRLEDIDDTHAAPVVVGIFGDADKLGPVKAALPWARITPVDLGEGKLGFSFRPAADDAQLYRGFAAKASSGGFSGVDVVLLKVTTPTQ